MGIKTILLMSQLADTSFEKLLAVYQKYFSMGYINSEFDNKLGLITLVCHVTYLFRKQGKQVTCYDVLLKIGKDCPEYMKNEFLKSLAVICEDMMYGCTKFPDFGLKPKDMPSEIKRILDCYCPF